MREEASPAEQELWDLSDSGQQRGIREEAQWCFSIDGVTETRVLARLTAADICM